MIFEPFPIDAFFVSCILFLACAGLLPVVKNLAKTKGFVDLPGGRKRHEEAVPPIGGVVVFPLFLVGLFFVSAGQEVFWLAAGIVLLLVTGAIDDRKGVAPRVKFLVQCLAALLVILPGQLQVLYLGNLLGFGDIWTGWMAIPFTLAAVMLLVNAVNLIDGLDGLAGGMGLIVLLWVMSSLLMTGNGGAAAGVVLLSMLLLAFLLFNLRAPWRKRAVIFLGDAGSLSLGLCLAWFAVKSAQHPFYALPPISVAWILALPIYDTCAQFARRMRSGRHPFSADHHHFHHHFIHIGLRPGQATAIILLFSALLGGIGVIGFELGVPQPVLSYVWIAGLLLHIRLSLRPSRYRRLIKFLFAGMVQTTSDAQRVESL